MGINIYMKLVPLDVPKVGRRCEYKDINDHNVVMLEITVIGHGIGGKDIPIMAHLAKARCWSER